MTALANRAGLQRALLWIIPAVVLAAIVCTELYLSRGESSVVPPAAVRPPAPVKVGLLPPYAIAGGPDAFQAIGDHTLFNPTRKPAPPAESTASGPTRLQRGQFVLTGTQVFGDKAVAYLKGAKDGKPHTVRLGETIEGMRVASITPNAIRFTVDRETEELTLKVAVGPKVTLQPVIEPTAPNQPGLPVGPSGGASGAAPVGAPVPMTNYGGTNPAGAPQSLAERRRAARAAQAQGGAAANQGAGATNATAGRRGANTTPSPQR